MASRLKFFDAMITSVVCFAAGHRKIYTSDLQKLDVHCRKLLRRVVGPPADIDWNQPWHTILHAWHRRIDQQLEYHGFKMWSTKYLSEYWKFANYVALLDDNRWAKRILHWNLGGGRPGRPFFQWQTPLQNFCRWHHLGNWIDTAGSTDLWFQYYTDFISFCQGWCYIFTFSCLVCTYNAFAFHFLCPKWAAARHTGSKSKKKYTVQHALRSFAICTLMFQLFLGALALFKCVHYEALVESNLPARRQPL